MRQLFLERCLATSWTAPGSRGPRGQSASDARKAGRKIGAETWEPIADIFLPQFSCHSLPSYPSWQHRKFLVDLSSAKASKAADIVGQRCRGHPRLRRLVPPPPAVGALIGVPLLRKRRSKCGTAYLLAVGTCTERETRPRPPVARSRVRKRPPRPVGRGRALSALQANKVSRATPSRTTPVMHDGRASYSDSLLLCLSRNV